MAAQMARQANARLKVVLCIVEKHVRRARLMQRHRKVSQPLIDPSTIPNDERDRFAHLPPHTLVLRTEEPLEALVTQVRAFLL